MRTIKFRAWDGSMKKMIQPENLINLEGETSDSMADYYTLMQFTGLTDRNGKEIYEGDCDREGDYVIFCQECMGWQFAYKWNDEEVCHNCDGDYLFIDSVANFEVTGNIYETKNQSK